MDELLQALGVLAFILNVWGNLALTRKGVSGWIVRLACNICWIPYCFSTIPPAWPLLANHILFAGINIYGWRKWTMEAREIRTRRARDLPPL